MTHPEEQQETSDDAAVLTLAETAETLRISRTTLWRLIRDGELTAFRFGSRGIPPTGFEPVLPP